jgi:hypothetical protein
LITLNSTPTANLTADNFQNTAFFLSWNSDILEQP